ncbi:MAG: SMI1/KNR4 family protein [Gemmataceae bacterium]
MKAVWKRIHAWLDENAPAGYGHLRPGATTDAIQAAEQAMGLKLPAEVKASYRVHDGQSTEPGLIGGEGWCLLPIDDVGTWWRKWSERNQRFRACVPLAWGGTGDVIFIDLNPEAEAGGGSVIVQRSDTRAPDAVAPSFRLWLKDFADQLEDEEFAYSEADGCLMYADEIDLD